MLCRSWCSVEQSSYSVVLQLHLWLLIPAVLLEISYFMPYGTRNPIPACADHGHPYHTAYVSVRSWNSSLMPAACLQQEESERLSTFCQLCFTVAVQNNWAGPRTRAQAWLLFAELSGVYGESSFWLGGSTRSPELATCPMFFHIFLE